VLSYFASFDLAAVAVTRDGRLLVTRNPAGHEAAWWGRASDLGRVLKRAARDSGDVMAAAVALDVRLVEHSAALQRTEQLVSKLNARMHVAQAGGELQIFNQSYRRCRLARTAAGQPTMSFTVARSRLRQALADTAAGKAPGGIVARVFEIK
jgi:hypothetical protein